MNIFRSKLQSANQVILYRYLSYDIYKFWCDLFNMPSGVLEWLPNTTSNANWFMFIKNDMEKGKYWSMS